MQGGLNRGELDLEILTNIPPQWLSRSQRRKGGKKKGMRQRRGKEREGRPERGERGWKKRRKRRVKDEEWMTEEKE